MDLIYDKFSPVYPSRPDDAITYRELKRRAAIDEVAQFKMNGTGSVLYKAPDGAIIVKTRHQEDHKAWVQRPEYMVAFNHLPGWNVICAELMHSKVSGLRNIWYINDILVLDGKWLNGTLFMDRQNMLKKLFLKGGEESTKSHHVIDKHTWLAKNYRSGFVALFDGIDLVKEPELEGLVLKKTNVPMAFPFRPKSNSNWQCKIRVPSNKYDH